MRITRALMAATEISPIIENFNIGNICTVIADMCVADTGNIAVPVIADKGVNIADLRIADISTQKQTNGVYECAPAQTKLFFIFESPQCSVLNRFL